MTTRDCARFGRLFLQNGRVRGRQIVPPPWVAASTRPSVPTEPGAMQYRFHWWIPPGALLWEFMAEGIYGQFIHVNRPTNVVIALNAADVKFLNNGVEDRQIFIYRAIADNL